MSSGWCYAHLPGVRLAEGGDHGFASGAVESLSFDRWRALDDVLVDEWHNYERSAPVFYRQEFDVDDEPSDEIVEQAQAVAGAFFQTRAVFGEVVHVVHAAMTVATGGILPHPSFSVTYFDLWPGRISPSRAIGPFERETIVFGHRHGQTVLSSAQVESANLVHEQLSRRPRPSYPELWWAIRTLDWSSRPEFSALNRFLHSVMAIESLLVPERFAKKEAFTNRTVALVTATGDGGRFRKRCELLYDVRSDLLHGRDYRKTMEREAIAGEELWDQGRAVLAAVIRGLLMRLDQVPTRDGDWAAVVDALHSKGERPENREGSVR